MSKLKKTKSPSNSAEVVSTMSTVGRDDGARAPKKDDFCRVRGMACLRSDESWRSGERRSSGGCGSHDNCECAQGEEGEAVRDKRLPSEVQRQTARSEDAKRVEDKTHVLVVSV